MLCSYKQLTMDNYLISDTLPDSYQVFAFYFQIVNGEKDEAKLYKASEIIERLAVKAFSDRLASYFR